MEDWQIASIIITVIASIIIPILLFFLKELKEDERASKKKDSDDKKVEQKPQVNGQGIIGEKPNNNIQVGRDINIPTINIQLPTISNSNKLEIERYKKPINQYNESNNKKKTNAEIFKENECPKCHGTGRVVRSNGQEFFSGGYAPHISNEEICPACEGSQIMKKPDTQIINKSKIGDSIQSSKNQNELLFDKKKIHFDAKEEKVFEFQFEVGDIIEGCAEEIDGDLFNIWLFDKENYIYLRKKMKAIGVGEDRTSAYNVEWTIGKSGRYYLVITNNAIYYERIINLSLTRHREIISKKSNGSNPKCEIRCQFCRNWFPSGIQFGDEKSFFSSSLIGNRQRCPFCKRMTPCNKENMRFSGVIYEGKNTL